jgi:hypothetical protein
MIKNDIDINKLIDIDYKVPESVFDKKRTKTTHFMLNAIFPKSSLTATEYFVNAFIGDGEYVNTVPFPIFVLFKVKRGDNKWDLLINRLRQKSEYRYEYICGREGDYLLRMVVFQTPQIYANDYVRFKQGKYSQFSKEYKKTFMKYTNNDKAQAVESTVWRVIHKSDSLKKELEKFFNVPLTSKVGKPFEFGADDELWGIPENEYEIYRYKKVKGTNE